MIQKKVRKFCQGLSSLAILYGLSACPVQAEEAAADPAAFTATQVSEPGPILDPTSPVWERATPVRVEMMAQVTELPHDPDPAVKELEVRAVHNGQYLSLLLRWADPTKDDVLRPDAFGDQVAVQLPIDAENVPSPMMGHKPGGKVNILQWRAAFQHDQDKGEPTIHALYPNAVIDIYPDYVLRATDSRVYSGALGVDNPVSRGRVSPVLDQMAEGWGTLTVKPDQQGDGKGIWQDGMWNVVINLPLATISHNAPRLLPGKETMTAFAVWDGGHGEVGSRKSWSNWLPLKLQRGQP
ncbi:MAG TPA: ethylbenzene dehydrogenase-related protein [Thiobacillaceae bacterium]|nr:ethylbenzene dehydrogenase-related protein [Thiobacillaceae bacterium]HNU65429.1 ethylbenzene dehydrogenase-related protein [Thiobacillaceae bacterium]